MRRVVIVVALVALAVPSSYCLSARATWEFLGEGWAPAALKNCPPETKITINTNTGVLAPWRRFCYWGSS